MTTTSDLNQTARDYAGSLGRKVKSDIENETVARATDVKHAAADRVQNTAEAAHAAVDQLDAQTPQAQAVAQFADQVEGLATKLRTTDIATLSRQTADIARANPLLFIGGAAVAGFAVARFLKARNPERSDDVAESDPWAAPYAGSRGSEEEIVGNDSSVLAQINGERGHA
ncbi:hypothetical protein DS901_11395 [Loktanella sp. D2R18]|uniref:hypothetical protein n=1 Tax=Rhodobacterales TaxID=204455 RepID=UPI000DFCB19D|nr:MULTISPECIES: hypothetical protein [Rhodobacterales]MDO6590351.1 hypothetical protein [Yoonia sp. 1_MG-2023]RBW42848.1 hypothetical protein DS901_11395 [Loktanella sp. D2R18]